MAYCSPYVPVLLLFRSLNFGIIVEIILLGLLCGALVYVWVLLESSNCFRLLSGLLWRSFASVLVLIGFLFGPGSARGASASVAFWSFHGSFLRCMDMQ